MIRINRVVGGKTKNFRAAEPGVGSNVFSGFVGTVAWLTLFLVGRKFSCC